jgi:hypothetical protein
VDTTGPTRDEFADLLWRFRKRTLPKASWTHAAHLAVGLWHVKQYGSERALSELRARIQRLNDSHGTPNTDTGGYHETITRAYVELIAALLATLPPGTPVVDCLRALFASPVSGKHALLTYYSKDRLMSVEARRRWIEPNRRPLCDRLRGAGGVLGYAPPSKEKT